MEYLLENILNMIGFLVGISVGLVSFFGYKNTGSPVLFRMSIAFLSIGIGFFIIWMGYLFKDLLLHQDHIDRSVQTLGIAVQTIGYFFIAFSHGIKLFFPKNRALRSVAAFPLLISGTHIEHVLRSVSFIFLVYGAIETILSYANTKKKSVFFVAGGLTMLAFGEFIAWYSVLFPESSLYNISVLIKIAGLISLFIPVGRVSLRRVSMNKSG
ncbi:MAG: putative membrane protein [Cenarchaeum symbiont of Oopsacas minuta]|nr:putative membrane protein [Cenarchaeum symbiont of Oopsacas minuta]